MKRGDVPKQSMRSNESVTAAFWPEANAVAGWSGMNVFAAGHFMRINETMTDFNQQPNTRQIFRFTSILLRLQHDLKRY